VGYAGAVVAALRSEYPIDPKAIYAVGISNGSAMTNALAETFPSLWAAIGIISAGGFTYSLEPAGAPLLPVFSTHGTGDATIAYGNSQSSAAGVGAINAWASHNGCSGSIGARNADAGGIMTNGSAALSSTGLALGGFSAGDVGAHITVLGAGVAGAPLTTTISAFTDATHVTLAAAASTTVASATFYWGTSATVPSSLVAGTSHVYLETFSTPGTTRGDMSFYSIAGGTHTWPGPLTMKNGALVNSGPDAEWDVNPALWAFLSAHRKTVGL
jgi:poly(3-hydroxybutyrate) depolymerase